jgi:two-component system response regulator TctD
MRILLLEDAEDVADAIVASFARRGDAVDHAVSVAMACDFLAVQDYDVAILDIELPDGSGLEVLCDLRARRSAVPVLMLTARGKIDDRVAALDRGADDYLVKPFDLRELEARVRALARRASEDRAGMITLGNVQYDPAALTLAVGGLPVALTRREFSLLETLVANRGRVVPKERILERMYAFSDEAPGSNAVELYIGRLRRKLEGSSLEIRTLRGLGYQLVSGG